MEELKKLLITASTDIRTYIALGSLVFAVVAYRRHKRKRLAYEVISNVPLFSVEREIKDRIKIYLDDFLVEKVNLVLIRIYNPGNDAIATKDFESSIAVNFGDMAKILSVEISEKSPVDLPANISYDDSSIKLEPLLLNEKDSVTIKVLVSKPQNAITVGARITGISKIEDRTDNHEPFLGTRNITQMLVWVIVVSFFASALEPVFREVIYILSSGSSKVIKLTIFVAVAAIGFYIVFWKQKRKTKR